MMQEKELKAFAFACMDKAVQTGVSRLSIQNGDFSLTIETQPHSKNSTEMVQPVQPAQVDNESDFDGIVVQAPLVGTFYAASAPEEPPLVQPGDRVKKGEQLCIIEAMKVMNSIESPCDGTVSRVMAVNGDLVEYHQPLFVIKENA
ncbi:MAG: acetyl-CoA carboxylase biotin carboxyl carrier protein subunit [Eubacteriales bacterium]|nr:acetyl-CoA carboxylase biotin carboxyl carrier protein subunit [Eubacteriales bacterium]